MRLRGYQEMSAVAGLVMAVGGSVAFGLWQASFAAGFWMLVLLCYVNEWDLREASYFFRDGLSAFCDERDSK